MDNLTACAIAARKLGMTYGQYMLQKKQMPIQKKVEPDANVRYCKECGKPLRPEDWRRKYCSDDCQRVVNSRRANELARKKAGISEDDILICPNCNKEFRRGDRHGMVKYCSDECRYEMTLKKRAMRRMENG